MKKVVLVGFLLKGIVYCNKPPPPPIQVWANTQHVGAPSGQAP